MYWLGVHITLLILLRDTLSEEENCFSLFNRCDANYNCFAAMLNVKLECNELLTGVGKICTQSCRSAIEKLQSDPYGKYFLECSCDRDAECLTHQARAMKCWKNRMNTGKEGCATFSRQCNNNTECTGIMERFYLKCTHLISGTECTPTCEIVQEIMYSHNITKGLLNCECSGTLKEEKFCRGIRAHTHYLCKTSPLLKPVKAADSKNSSNGNIFNVASRKDINSASTTFKLEMMVSLIVSMFTIQFLDFIV